MVLEGVQEAIEKAKDLERLARPSTTHFAKKAKMLFEEIDNMMWRGNEKAMVEWCKMNKVYDKITEDEIVEIWNGDDGDGENSD